MPELGELKIIERGPYLVVGAYSIFEGDDEGRGWSGASRAFNARRDEIANGVGDTVLGLLYRPHRDHPEISESVRTCLMGVEVADLNRVPEGLSTTRFSGGRFVAVACRAGREYGHLWGRPSQDSALRRFVPDDGDGGSDAVAFGRDGLWHAG